MTSADDACAVLVRERGSSRQGRVVARNGALKRASAAALQERGRDLDASTLSPTLSASGRPPDVAPCPLLSMCT